MEFESLKKEILGKKIKPIYLLHGEEPFFIDQVEHLLEENVLTEAEKAFNQTIFYAKDTNSQQVLEALKRAPMMSERQLVVLREAQDFKEWDQLVAYVKAPYLTSVFVVCFKYKKFDSRLGFYKNMSPKAVDFVSKKIYEDKVPTWISSYLAQKGYSISTGAALLTGNHLGAELSNISNELDKLCLILPKGTMIDKFHIEKYIGINKDFNVFELQKALVKRDAVLVNRIVQYFEANIKKNPLVMTISTMYSYFMKTYLYHEVANSDNATKAKVLGVNPFFIKDYQAAANRWNVSKLMYIFHILREYDVRSKGVNNNHVSEAQLCKELFLKIQAV